MSPLASLAGRLAGRRRVGRCVAANGGVISAIVTVTRFLAFVFVLLLAALSPRGEANFVTGVEHAAAHAAPGVQTPAPDRPDVGGEDASDLLRLSSDAQERAAARGEILPRAVVRSTAHRMGERRQGPRPPPG